jgi:hypothetical protein
MKSSRLGVALGFAVFFALATHAVQAQGDQSDVISAHGDALSRATSAGALVEPMPSRPPNSAPPVIPSASVARQAAPTIGTPSLPGTLPAGAPLGRRRDYLIAAGVIISLAMFLWDRRKKD